MKKDIKQLNSRYTPEYIQREETEFTEAYRAIMNNKQEVIHLLNQWICENTVQAKKNLLQFFKDPSIKNYIDSVLELRYLNVVIKGYEEEIRNREHTFILQKERDMEQLIDVVLQLKFYLWRVEFRNDETSMEDLKRYIEQKRISKTFLSNWIERFAYNPEMVRKRVMNTLYEEQSTE